MAKLVLAMFTSLDGYIEGPAGFAPPPWSAQVGDVWAHHNLSKAGHLLYGRINFEFNRDFWTSPAAMGRPETETMNCLPKTVVSKSLVGDPGWNGSLVRGDVPGLVATLKSSVTGGDIYSFGGAGLARSLMVGDLVDEYYLMVTPNLVGGGKRLFDSGMPSIDLNLIAARELDVGSVVLHYRRAKRTA
ncbi:MAG: dihydrofolate reductase family protein [Acetobacteraceae bacterium]